MLFLDFFDPILDLDLELIFDLDRLIESGAVVDLRVILSDFILELINTMFAGLSGTVVHGGMDSGVSEDAIVVEGMGVADAVGVDIGVPPGVVIGVEGVVDPLTGPVVNIGSF